MPVQCSFMTQFCKRMHFYLLMWLLSYAAAISIALMNVQRPP